MAMNIGTVCIKRYESFVNGVLNQWLSPSVIKGVKDAEDKLIGFFNPDIPANSYLNTPPSSYPMSTMSSSLFTTIAYLFSILFLSLIVKLTLPNPVTLNETSSKSVSLARKFTKEPILVLAVFYNIVQVVLCTYMAVEAVRIALDLNYSLFCNTFDLRNHRVAEIYWVFNLSKILDFGDTFLIILRRKWRQLSFLHVYHHASIYFLSWLNLRTGYDGDIYYTVVANASIHAIMYSYYLCTVLEINFVRENKWVKKLVTNMQMIQFVTMLAQAVYLAVFNCEYPRRLIYLYFAYVCSMLALFANFANVNYYMNRNKKLSKRD